MAVVPEMQQPCPSDPKWNRAHRTLSVLVAFAALIVVGCFEEPVREEIALTFTADHQLLAEWATTLAAPEEWMENRSLGQRLQGIEASLFGGWHPWLVRFDQFAPDDEGATWQRTEGRLTRYQRWALFEDPSAVADLFAGTSLGATYAATGGIAELIFHPSTSTATREERELVAEALDTFATSLATHLEAGEALWTYLERNPGRRRACFAALFDVEGEGALHPSEESLVERLGETTSSLLEVVLLEPDRAETLDELSRRVFDPFPLDVVVVAPETARELEGFEREADGRIRASRLSLWSGFSSLEGRWLAPDPALAFVRHERSGGDEPFPLDSFVARPFRHASPPAPYEVRDALLAALEPPERYRAVWNVSRSESPGE